MSDKPRKTKSITVRLEEQDMAEWAAAQNSPASSVRMAIKSCMLLYGMKEDLPEAVLKKQYGRPQDFNHPSFASDTGSDEDAMDLPDAPAPRARSENRRNRQPETQAQSPPVALNKKSENSGMSAAMSSLL